MISLAERMNRVIRHDVQGMHGYAIQASAGFVKLDTMENPFRLPDALQQELGERLRSIAINRYPAERTDVLRDALARHAQMPDDCALTLGNGSDELITMLSMAGDVPGACVLAPTPGFVMYKMSAQLQGIRFVGVPLLRRLLRFSRRSLRFEQFRKLVRRHGPAEIKALEFIARVRAQKVRLRLGFHTLRDHGHTQIPAHCYGGLGNTTILRMIGQVVNKRAIDLDSVDWKFPEVG